MLTTNLFQNASEYKSYDAGETIFEVGSPATHMFVVKEGEVDIIVNDMTVETAGEGMIFGEMALIDDKPRSATAKAKTDCHLVPIDEKRFTFLVQQTPFFAIHVMKVLAYRIRNINTLL